ncbi:Palmitoyl-monogalactosyldiacylglycerol delta-7 desaturase, chloroplastic [Tetrabaena socialis]|uniref:Palmitoyl-monogalactosyldiacylglycerol delta-7 desaturase, chloroplastic n=1 Tax=Tetrabaena socialis TaxID=47790 RepID=A0A2J7ZYJ6_9CHLO|nr:Palmitoyl-monogalactosyldiacylglycerol delta-7 desaturase, chloroplastic [Tetrabaena socialis]|eukprot:PNH05341.1 Palmitoyl-monogalactosyldiacylglycerol delta-7 desaturase, chloroplastic [Tetrabaena socialis]
MPMTSSPTPTNASEVARFAAMSYSQQYDELFSNKPLNIKKVVPKPSKEAQAAEPGAGQVFMSDVHTIGKRSLVDRPWNVTDMYYTAFIGGMHLLALAAPLTFSWNMVALFLGSYFVTGCLGITLSYHRQLSHKSFSTPKWLEYILAYCGVLAVQGDPLEWASSHRYHHLHTDTPLDPHSPYEGFWWCHMGWLLDNNATMERVSNRGNADDLESQWYYRFLRDTYMWHVVAQFAVLFLAGGLPAVVWGGALRMCWVWHITWFVNSASHCWGYQVDMTWGMVCLLEKLGLASNIKLPTERQKAKLAFKPATAAAQ